MPLYDYQCADCGTTFEIKLTFDEVDTARPTCPRCGSGQTTHRIGRVLIKRGHSANRLTNDQMMAAAGYAQALGGPHLDGHAAEHSHTEHAHEEHHD